MMKLYQTIEKNIRSFIILIVILKSNAVPSPAHGSPFTQKKTATKNDQLKQREANLKKVLIDIVEKELENCTFSFVIGPNFGYEDTIAHLLMLPNPKQVVGLKNSIEDMDSIIWSQGFCSTYFFLLNDLRPLIEFCDESENQWDYNGRYVVVTRNADDLEKITTTMKGRKTEQILGIIPAQKSDHWILFTNKFYWENGISSLKTTLDKKAEVAYFPDKTSNMNGATIRFITFQWVPNIFLVKDEDGTIVDTYGVEVETVKSVAETMNFKLDLQEPPNGERWGSKISEGNWTGLLGKLFRNEGDIGVANIFISASRGEAVAFSAPFATPRVCFLCGVPPSLPQWQSVFLPFQPELWGAYGVSILVCGIMLYFFIRNKREIVNCFLISLQAHIKEPSVFLETRTTVRVFAGVMWLYCIILTTAYSSKLTAFLTITTKPSTYETIKELYEADVPVYGLSPFLKDALTSSVDPTIKNLADHFVVLRESEIFDKVAGAKGAFMQDESYLKYIGQTKLKRKSRLMKECFAWYNVAMVLQRHSPLKKKIDAITKRIVASGMVEKWFEDSIVKAQAREETKSTSEKTLNDDAATDISLTLTHLQGVFFIYIFLSFLAFVIFIVELIAHTI